MSQITPLLIVMTPVRNEAWVLRAFLEATSLWADYIIIADQMSTDGSREIAKEYPKVILIDNDRKDMHMAATRRLLFEEARKIKGDKILFALDADEFLSGDFINTDDWKKIVNSKPDDSFSWRWMNLKKDDVSQYYCGPHFYWAVHESFDLWEGEFPDKFIHEWRLPWSPKADESHSFNLDDFFSIHLAWVNQARQRNKERFYQVSTWGQQSRNSCISLYRHYHTETHGQLCQVPTNAYKFYEDRNLNIWDYVDLEDDGAYYSMEILRFFERDGVKKYAWLDIWNQDWISKYNVKDPRSIIQKTLHWYLQHTQAKSSCFLIRGIDKILKQFI